MHWHYQATLTHKYNKMGRWKGVMLKEYTREELTYYLAGMSTNMKHNFKFVNASGNAYHNVTSTCLETNYNINCATATAA
jgi:hypothetical protein